MSGMFPNDDESKYLLDISNGRVFERRHNLFRVGE